LIVAKVFTIGQPWESQFTAETQRPLRKRREKKKKERVLFFLSLLPVTFLVSSLCGFSLQSLCLCGELAFLTELLGIMKLLNYGEIMLKWGILIL